MPYEYTDKARRQRTPHEQALIDYGYPWVSQTSLRAFAPHGDSTHGHPLPDRLGEHEHHSPNTHLIVENTLELRPLRADEDAVNFDRALRGTRLSANDNGLSNKEKRMSPLTCYVGKAGRKGCKFVEGHVSLSPCTADRFEQRGDIEWVDDGQSQDDWFEQEGKKGLERKRPGPVPNHVLHQLYPRRESKL